MSDGRQDLLAFSAEKIELCKASQKSYHCVEKKGGFFCEKNDVKQNGEVLICYFLLLLLLLLLLWSP